MSFAQTHSAVEEERVVRFACAGQLPAPRHMQVVIVATTNVSKVFFGLNSDPAPRRSLRRRFEFSLWRRYRTAVPPGWPPPQLELNLQLPSRSQSDHVWSRRCNILIQTSQNHWLLRDQLLFPTERATARTEVVSVGAEHGAKMSCAAPQILSAELACSAKARFSGILFT